MAWDRLTSFITGGAVSRALGPPLDAQFEPARQNAWMRRRYRVAAAREAAEARARHANENLTFASTARAPGGAAASAWGRTAVSLDDDAGRNGFSPERFNLYTRMAQRVPGFGTALALLRRRLIDPATFEAIHKHEGMAPGLLHALHGLEFDPLSPEDVANAIQQGFLDNPGILPPPEAGDPPFEPPVEQVNIDPVLAAAMGGVDRDELAVMTQLSGNPPGPMQLLDMLNRGIITDEGVNRGIREGRTKTKWIPALKLLRWNVLTGTQVVNLWLRGWIDEQRAKRLGVRAGYDAETLELLYLGQGRPLSWHQTWIGLKRGGVYDGPLDGIDPAFLRSLRQSNIRPEWYNLAWAQRYSYPSAFVMRALVQDGTLTQAEGEADLIDMGWRPDRARQVTTTWAAGGGAGGVRDQTAAELATEYEGGYLAEPDYRGQLATLGYDAAAVEAKVALGATRKAKAARDRAATRIGTSYIGYTLSRAEAEALLERAVDRPEARAIILDGWDLAREANVKQMTAAQVRAAFKKGHYTRDEALAELAERGWRPVDAEKYLDSA